MARPRDSFMIPMPSSLTRSASEGNQASEAEKWREVRRQMDIILEDCRSIAAGDDCSQTAQ